MTTENTHVNSDRAQALAQLVDCLTEEDLCALCSITPSTAETWRKRHKGPSFALVGNRVLYPRRAVSAFVEQQLRERGAEKSTEMVQP